MYKNCELGRKAGRIWKKPPASKSEDDRKSNIRRNENPNNLLGASCDWTPLKHRDVSDHLSFAGRTDLKSSFYFWERGVVFGGAVAGLPRLYALPGAHPVDGEDRYQTTSSTHTELILCRTMWDQVVSVGANTTADESAAHAEHPEEWQLIRINSRSEVSRLEYKNRFVLDTQDEL